ncbi:MAG TPA: cobaltochelatase subunit CobN, partial [Pyrinomonadaceae bacterium]
MEKSAEERDRRVLELWERVLEVEQRLIPTGLHVFGRAAGERECVDLLRAVASFDRPECGARSLNDLVAEGLGLGSYEGLLQDKSEQGWNTRARVDDAVRASV